MFHFSKALLDAAIEPRPIEPDAGFLITGVIFIILPAVVAAAVVIAAILVIYAVRKQRKMNGT